MPTLPRIKLLPLVHLRRLDVPQEVFFGPPKGLVGQNQLRKACKVVLLERAFGDLYGRVGRAGAAPISHRCLRLTVLPPSEVVLNPVEGLLAALLEMVQEGALRVEVRSDELLCELPGRPLNEFSIRKLRVYLRELSDVEELR